VTEERLQKLMSHAGIGSRRACETIIEQGRVTVNGRVAELGMKADPAVDDIRVDGQPLKPPKAYDYIMLNKPRNVISDEDVGGNWPAARELIPLEGHLYPVGRLDVPSEGLMLFTNDGDLAHRLTHPSYEHPKTYRVWVDGNPGDDVLDAWRRGVVVEGQRTLPAEVTRTKRQRDTTLLEVTMREGRKRQIRRIAAVLGHPVQRLERIKLGPLELGDLPPGSWRRLTDEEVQAIKEIRQQRKPRRSGGKLPARRRSGGAAPGQDRQQRPSKQGPGRQGPSKRRPRRK
jgi:pseudouridine synthase